MSFEKNLYDFLLVINSNLYLICHLFWDTATYPLNISDFFTPPLFNLI